MSHNTVWMFLRGFAPRGRWRTLTFVGVLRCDRLTAPCVFDGPINGICFLWLPT